MVKISIHVRDQTEDIIFRSASHVESIEEGVELYERIIKGLVDSGATVEYVKDTVVSRVTRLRFNTNSIILSITNKKVNIEDTTNDVLRDIFDVL